MQGFVNLIILYRDNKEIFAIKVQRNAEVKIKIQRNSV